MGYRSGWHLGWWMLATVVWAGCQRSRDPGQDPDYPWQGEFQAADQGWQIAALGRGQFRGLQYPGGLPGAGWGGADPQAWEGTLHQLRELHRKQSLRSVRRQSPTLGAAPPPGAVRLFDGTAASLKTHWQPGAGLTEDGLLRGGATTLARFGDYTLHVEFRTPYEPDRRGQLRGNSGVYLQGRYEIQILDSCGWPSGKDACGAVYRFRQPDVPICLPPLAWQTYDIEFTMARRSGVATSDVPRVTLRWNGEVVHQDVVLVDVTTKAPLVELHEPGPIYLQDHGSPVHFRNIWLLPTDTTAHTGPVP